MSTKHLISLQKKSKVFPVLIRELIHYTELGGEDMKSFEELVNEQMVIMDKL